MILLTINGGNWILLIKYAYLQKKKRKQLINVLKEDCIACILNGKKMFVQQRVGNGIYVQL